ncbi:MAG: tripartite tricarboxylate transporter substrate binding protein [Deltaproteobacteria bacterium]|nr:tripartite tricarboxylate transporter substrate binding protein [Deltaproteobacteria bacterium]
MDKKKAAIISAILVSLVWLVSPEVGFCKWPTKQLNIVVPYGAGGTTDRVMRGLAPFLEKEIGAPVVIVNRPGGGALVGTKAHLANDPADGSFIVYTIQPYLSGQIAKKAFTIDSFDYFGLNYRSPQGVWVKSDSKYDTMEKLIKAIKETPTKIKMAYIPNSWSPVASALLAERIGAEAKGIPYEGGGVQRMAIVSGDCDFTITEVYGTLAAAAQDMKALAVVEEERLPEIPNVPTLNEVLKKIGASPMPDLSNTRFFLVKKGFKEKYPERWTMLLQAMEKAHKNPDFIAMMAKQKLEVTWKDAEATRKSVVESDKICQKYAKYLE